MISIKPKWCELIASGQKTIEVRKTKPKLETPFKVYIYCTNTRPYLVWGDVFRGDWETEFTHLYGYNRKDAEKIWDVFNGKVIGEFVCDEIVAAECGCYCNLDPTKTLLQAIELLDYADGKRVYGWHISDLEIYDTPKELSEFYRHDTTYDNSFGGYFEDRDKRTPITRPPQSWCYVESVEGEKG